MNAIEYCINYIKRHIPREVLYIGLVTPDDVINKYTTIDDKIITNVINPIVKVDLNLMGGVITQIELNRCRIEQIPHTFDFLIKVPKHLTAHRSIIAVHHLMSRLYSRDDKSYVGNYHRLTPMGIASKVLSATDNRAIITTSRLELVGENVILCKEPACFLYNTIMECQVENHQNLENINRQTYEYVAKLALLACKMYIWTNKTVSLNMGELYGGHELNSIKDIIDEYKDAHEQYVEHLQGWSAYSITNSKLKMREYIRSMLGQSF